MSTTSPATVVWTFPDVTPGDHILASRDPTRSDRTLAIVTKLKESNNAVHAIDAIAFFPGGTVSLRDLWHADDPRIKNEPLRFKNASNGVFVVAPDKECRTNLLARMTALEQRFAALERYVANDDSPAAVPVPDETAISGSPKRQPIADSDIFRPRRGRPPKVRTPEGVTA